MRILGGDKPRGSGAGHPTERIRIMQSSMQVGDTPAQASADAAEVFATADRLGVDLIGFSETERQGHVFKAVAEQADRFKWPIQRHGGNDCRFALAPRHQLVADLNVHVADGRGGMPSGNYSDRGVAEITFRTPAGNLITGHSTHWLTAYKLDRHPGPENRREATFTEQTKAMIERVKLHGAGSRIAFWQGDTNLDEQKDTGFDSDAIHARFKRAGLLSAWDELHKPGSDLPATHGGPRGSTLDVIGSYAPDRRVRALDCRVLPRPGRHSDHHIVVATYAIRLPA